MSSNKKSPKNAREFREFSLEKRKELYQKIKIKYPNGVGIIMSAAPKCKNLPPLPSYKYIIDGDTLFSHFISEFRTGINLSPERALFFYVGNGEAMPCPSKTMNSIHELHKDEDGFLYCVYVSENTFGVSHHPDSNI